MCVNGKLNQPFSSCRNVIYNFLGGGTGRELSHENCREEQWLIGAFKVGLFQHSKDQPK